MTSRRLAHLSDLHLGRDAATQARAQGLVEALLRDRIDHVIVTGDVTHRGLAREHELFRHIFAPLDEGGRLTVVPGNHDRLGDDLREVLMPGPRVQLEMHPGLWIVRLDSTGPHNRRWLHGHGIITPHDIERVQALLAAAPTGCVRVLALHHHPIELPQDSSIEALVAWLGFPFASELELGPQLLEGVAASCDLILHGHRHATSAVAVHAGGGAVVRLYNAGSSTSLGRVRVFEHEAGRLVAPPAWLPPGEPVRTIVDTAEPEPRVLAVAGRRR
jgi:3',5'-cyclic-AMP phosphodiesterase